VRVEDFIGAQVLPLYANTHTETSTTGRETTRLREDARRIVHRAVGGGSDDVVVFTGSGATGAIDRLLRILTLVLPAAERPVVLAGPYEHHSNELLWRESIADVVAIREDEDGRIDLGHLEEELLRHAERRLRIGSFSAASNVTGIVTWRRLAASWPRSRRARLLPSPPGPSRPSSSGSAGSRCRTRQRRRSAGEPAGRAASGRRRPRRSRPAGRSPGR
jgi:aminotransferase class V